MKTATRLLALILATGLTACETQEDNDLEAIRACTDVATQLSLASDSTAITKGAECETLLNSKNLTSKEAYELGFTLILIRENKLNRLDDMVTAMETNTSGTTNSLNGALSWLALSSNSVATELSTKASGIGDGAQMLASLITVATSVNSLTAFTEGDASSVQTNINTFVTTASDAEKETVAAAIISLQTSACSDPENNASTDENNVCYKAKQITNGSTDTATILANLNSLVGN